MTLWISENSQPCYKIFIFASVYGAMAPHHKSNCVTIGPYETWVYGAMIPHHKSNRVTKGSHETLSWLDALDKRPKGGTMDRRFGTWNTRSLHREAYLRKCRGNSLNVRFSGSAGGQMGGQWHRTSRWIHIYLWKGEWDPCIGYVIFTHKRIISAVSRVEFVSDRMSYIILRGCISLNVQAPMKDKIGGMKDSLYG
jgi:hypothetical protein